MEVAVPPRDVSLRDAGRDLPTLYIISIASSTGTTLEIPLSAISALIMALDAPMAFLF